MIVDHAQWCPFLTSSSSIPPFYNRCPRGKTTGNRKLNVRARRVASPVGPGVPPGPGGEDDADDGADHAIAYDGRVVVTARERTGGSDEQIQIFFDRVCRNEDNTRLQGFLSIGSSVGVNDRGQEGFQTIRVEMDRPSFAPSAPRRAPTRVSPSLFSIFLDYIKKSLHRLFRSPAQFAGDFTVRINADPDANAAASIISRVELVTGLGSQRLEFQPDAQGTGGIVKDVPVSTSATLRFVMESGAVIERPVNGILPAPKVESETPLSFESVDSAWPAMATAAGAFALAIEPEPPGRVERVRKWRVDIAPSYAPVRAGQLSPGEDSPIVEELDEAIRTGEVERLEELFGSSQPFEVAWSFRATNLTTGADVPVSVGTPAAGTEVGVALLAGRVLNVPNGSFEVTFPAQPPTDIYELEATAEVTDTNGFSNTVRHRLWSHVLSGKAEQLREGLLPVAAELAEVPVQDFLDAAEAEVEESLPDDEVSQARIAEMVSIGTLDVATDEHVSVDELRRLIRGARTFEPIGPDCLGVPATMVGTDGSDTLQGTAGDDVIVGLSGGDAIDGGAGDDIICGGGAVDIIAGGEGDDIVDGGRGSDTLSGDAGSDALNGGIGNDKIDGATGNDDIDGASGDDTIDGGIGNDSIDGGTGNDVIEGDAGNDIIEGGPNSDNLHDASSEDTCITDGALECP